MARSRHTLGREEELEECADGKRQVVEWWPLFDMSNTRSRSSAKGEVIVDRSISLRLQQQSCGKFVVGACCAVVQLLV